MSAAATVFVSAVRDGATGVAMATGFDPARARSAAAFPLVTPLAEAVTLVTSESGAARSSLTATLCLTETLSFTATLSFVMRAPRTSAGTDGFRTVGDAGLVVGGASLALPALVDVLTAGASTEVFVTFISAFGLACRAALFKDSTMDGVRVAPLSIRCEAGGLDDGLETGLVLACLEMGFAAAFFVGLAWVVLALVTKTFAEDSVFSGAFLDGAEVFAAEVFAAEVSAAEVSAAEVSAAEVSAAEVFDTELLDTELLDTEFLDPDVVVTGVLMNEGVLMKEVLAVFDLGVMKRRTP